MDDSNAVVLVGLMGSGKSSVGRLLAQRIGREYWDSDEVLRTTGEGANSLARTLGANALHQREAHDFVDAVQANRCRVFGAAASVVLDVSALTVLRASWVVWLKASVAVLASRLQREPSDRPFLSGEIESLLTHMSQERSPLYQQVADLVIHEDCLGAAEIAGLIASRLERSRGEQSPLG